MKPTLTAQPFVEGEPTRFVLMAGDMIFASPFVVNKPEDAHKLAEAWNAYEEPPKQRTLPMDALKRACRDMLGNSDVKPHTVAGRRMIHAFWVGVLSLQQALLSTPNPVVVINLMSGRHDELISNSKE